MSTPINDGGPAFPRPASEGHHVHDGEHIHGYGEQSGMTLRDWFAGQALIGQLSGDQTEEAPSHEVMADAESFASSAYIYADAMLKAREKRT